MYTYKNMCASISKAYIFRNLNVSTLKVSLASDATCLNVQYVYIHINLVHFMFNHPLEYIFI